MALQLQQHHQEVHASCGGSSSFLCTRIHKPVKFGYNLTHLSQTTPPFLPLSHSVFSSLPVELDSSSPLPLGWQKFLDLKSGSIYYKKDKRKECNKTMSRSGKSPKLDLRLNLSPPRRVITPPPSPPTSCISSENAGDTSSPETRSMILAGCPRCLMYVMLSEDDPRCPKCKNTVLLDFLQENHHTKKSRKS